MAATAAAKKIKRDERQAWIERETYLYHKMMDPRTYSRMVEEDGKPCSDTKKTAYSWKLYKKWIEHGTT